MSYQRFIIRPDPCGGGEYCVFDSRRGLIVSQGLTEDEANASAKNRNKEWEQELTDYDS